MMKKFPLFIFYNFRPKVRKIKRTDLKLIDVGIKIKKICPVNHCRIEFTDS